MNKWLAMGQSDRDLKDFIMLMLGAPVVNVELDESQIEESIKISREYLESYAIDDVELEKRGAYLHAMQILGNIRSNCNYDDPSYVGMQENGMMLMKQSRKGLKAWREEVYKRSQP